MEQNEIRHEAEIDLKELAFVLVKRVWIAVIAAVVFGLAGYLYTAKFVTPTYTSQAMFYVNDGSCSSSELLGYESLAKDYRVLINSRPILEAVIENNELDMSYSELESRLKLSSPAETRVIYVLVSDADPAVAKKLCDAICFEAEKRITDVMESEHIILYSEGTLPVYPSSPDRTKNTVLAAVIGFIIPLAIIIIRRVFDDTIITADDAERGLGVNIIGRIPRSEVLKDRRPRTNGKKHGISVGKKGEK